MWVVGNGRSRACKLQGEKKEEKVGQPSNKQTQGILHFRFSGPWLTEVTRVGLGN